MSSEAPISTQLTKAKILLVEDEPHMLQLVSWQLRGFGYGVVEARSAAEALQVLSNDDTGFDLLLTDVVLPDEPNGIDLAQRARQALGPDLKIILTSGYLEEEIIRHYGPPGEDMPLLPKPYTRDELAAALRSVLQARA
jgi:CheY-like chemotaxis protein